MIRTRVHLQLAVHGAAEWILRQHALDRDFDHALRMGGQHVLERGRREERGGAQEEALETQGRVELNLLIGS